MLKQKKWRCLKESCCDSRAIRRGNLGSTRALWPPGGGSENPAGSAPLAWEPARSGYTRAGTLTLLVSVVALRLLSSRRFAPYRRGRSGA